jgi:hypothetical protein
MRIGINALGLSPGQMGGVEVYLRFCSLRRLLCGFRKQKRKTVKS